MKRFLRKWPPALDLCLGGVIYGFGFVATKWALEDWSPLVVTFLRMAIAVGVGYLLLFSIPSLRRLKWQSDFSEAIVPGTVLAAELLFLTMGLRLTSIANSAFIASMYVILVPIIDSLVYKNRLPPRILAFVGISVLGVGLLSHVHTLSYLSLGDFFCLLSAFAAAIHILAVQRIAHKVQSAFVFNVNQCSWAGLIIGACMLIEQEPLILHMDWKPFLGLLCVSIGSTLFAIMLQVRGQLALGSSIASLLFLLDAPFSAFFGLILLGEHIDQNQFLGACLILLVSSAEAYFSRLKKRASRKARLAIAEALDKAS